MSDDNTQSTTQADDAVTRPESTVAYPHIPVMRQLDHMARLTNSLQIIDAHLGFAMQQARECGVPELALDLEGVQLRLDGLTGRLEPAVRYKGFHPQ